MVEMSTQDAQTFHLGFAGDTFNTAWYARHVLDDNWDVDFISALGGDIYSTGMMEFIEKNNIGTKYIARREGKSAGLYFIHQADGDRQFTYWRETSAARTLANNSAELEIALANSDLIYFSGITLAIIGEAGRKNLFLALANAKQNGAEIAFDPNIRPALWRDTHELKEAINQASKLVDIILPTFDDEAIAFKDTTPEATLDRYLNMGIDEIVVKDGAKNTLVSTQSIKSQIPTNPLRAIDATGAGDAFNGAYLSARLNQRSPEESARFAHKIAGKVILHPGALVDHALLAKLT